MIKTLVANNGTFVNTGNVQVQSAVNTLSYLAKFGSATMTSSQVRLPIPTFDLKSGTAVFTAKASLLDIINLISNVNFVLPSLQSRSNFLSPTYDLTSLKAKVSPQQITVPKKASPYEVLTGISQERPEIVMLTSFVPLFTTDVGQTQSAFINLIESGGIYPYMTDTGRFFDTQLQVANFQFGNMQSMVASLRRQYTDVDTLVAQRVSSFKQSLTDIGQSSDFLLTLIRSLNQMKAHLDLRDNIYDVNVVDVISSHVLGYEFVRTLNPNPLIDLAKKWFQPKYTLNDSLSIFGFKSDVIKNTFTSSKIWLQLLLEYKNLLQHHSYLLLDASPDSQKNDTNASQLTKSNLTYFGLKQPPNLPTLTTISNTSVAQIIGMTNLINQGFLTIYEGVNFKNIESQLVGLVNLVSQEFRYSVGLNNQNIQQQLKSVYGYDVKDSGNVGFLDAVVGQFGANITDVSQDNGSSLARVAQQQTDTATILTFESKYIDGSAGTLTAGSDYFVDQALKITSDKKIDTSRIDGLASFAENASKQFNTFVAQMNLLAYKQVDPNQKASSTFPATMASPVDLALYLGDQLLDRPSGTFNTVVDLRADQISSIFPLAVTNPKIKSLLFIYVIARISRAYNTNVPFFSSDSSNDNTPTTDAIMEMLVFEIQRVLLSTQTSTQVNTGFTTNSFVGDNTGPVRIVHDIPPPSVKPTLTASQIKYALKTGSFSIKFIESNMSQILSTLQSSGALSGNKTKYRGYSDTAIMMAVFDTLIQMLAAWCGWQLVSANQSSTNVEFTAALTVDTYLDSYHYITTTLEQETALIQATTYSIINALDQLNGSFKGYSNYLTSAATTESFNKIVNVVDDATLLQLLVSDQQIMLLSSLVNDYLGKISISNSNDLSDMAVSDIKSLDDSFLSPSLRNVIYGFFNDSRFSSNKSYNKKILTVGVPLGFTKFLKQHVGINDLKNTTTPPKQVDIVNVTVYKVDLNNGDLIFMPQRFLFELSRFPVRDDSTFQPIPDVPALNDIFRAVPTRDFGINDTTTDFGNPEYWQASFLGGNLPDAMADSSYDFLTNQEKAEVISNHISSYVLELYIKLLTGLSMADSQFDLVVPVKLTDDTFVDTLASHLIDQVVKVPPIATNQPIKGVLFTTSDVSTMTGLDAAGNVINQRVTNQQGNTFATVLSNLPSPTDVISSTRFANDVQILASDNANNLKALSSYRDVPLLLHGIRTLNIARGAVTTLAEPTSLVQRILRPKQFDRVLNVIIDPDDFEINYAKTVQSVMGKQVLSQMIESGEVVLTDELGHSSRQKEILNSILFELGVTTNQSLAQNRIPNTPAHFRLRQRDKRQGDVTLEKYFVSIETYGEDATC